ncbi:hypothetical protein HUG15_04385 [Salicibibacter cibarius]|uniref:Lipoprotein n=1 Tax=Salicibibacter cibarius TaxID=2743000 RepID=A0A7T7CAJ1_9BACI|nr:hypothetical protein [Salicibibacter cibarius]QQK74915.1 hypothetical protein HUG15_04385 [Salicibibacter cibarius]
MKKFSLAIAIAFVSSLGLMACSPVEQEEQTEEENQNNNESEDVAEESDNDANDDDSSSFTNVIAKLDESEVEDGIKAYAESIAEDDDEDELEAFTIEAETETYEELASLEIDNEAQEAVLKEAFDQYGYDFNGIKFYHRVQMEAYEEIQELELDNQGEEILEDAKSSYGHDYDMILFVLEEELQD